MFYGTSFEPYVGPFVGPQPVLWNTYTLAQVTTMLNAVKAAGFSRILTYGQGTFVWQGTPNIQDSNQYNIAAASAAGQKVSAGCYQQGADPGNDKIDVTLTKCEIDFALTQATQYGNVDELLITNESIWGPGSTKSITELIAYAKAQRTAAGLPLTVTTHQRWDVLAGIANKSPSYAPTRAAMLMMLRACEKCVYVNVYPYFDPNIWGIIGSNPTETVFKAAVTASLGGSMKALKSAFLLNRIKLEIRIGEIGWPTSGTQPAQPNPLGSVQLAKWHYEAVSAWLASVSMKGFLFEALDEPWKGDQAGDNSEAYFGKMTANGTASSVSQYTLNSVTTKY